MLLLKLQFIVFAAVSSNVQKLHLHKQVFSRIEAFHVHHTGIASKCVGDCKIPQLSTLVKDLLQRQGRENKGVMVTGPAKVCGLNGLRRPFGVIRDVCGTKAEKLIGIHVIYIQF